MTHQQLVALCNLIDAKIKYVMQQNDGSYSQVYDAMEVVRVLFEDD